MWQKIWQNKFFILIILLAVGVRLYAVLQPAHPFDMGTYQAWGQHMLDKGPAQFFSTTWSDYLPLPIYLFSGLSFLSTSLHLSFPLIFKLFFSLIELGLLAWILKLTRALSHSTIHYSLFTILLLLSPALIGNTSWWGQLDSLPALLTLISLLYFQKYLPTHNLKLIILTSALFAVALSIKPIMLLTLPVFLILYFTSPHRPRVLHSLFTILCSLFIFLFPALPVAGPIGAFRFLLDKALEQADTYPFTSINAFNFWTLRSSFTSWPPDNQVVLGLSAHTLGLTLFALCLLFTLNHWFRHKWSKQYAFRIVATILIAYFTFTTRMHERHLLFGLPFLALACLSQPWLILPYVLYTISYSLNLWAAYEWVVRSQTWPMPIVWANLASLVTTLTTLVLVFVWDWSRTIRAVLNKLKSHPLLVLILTLSLCLRLFNLSSPPVHIFDEVYHAFTAEELVKNNLAAWEWWTTPPAGFAYEWTHPPVAKYGMVAGLLLFGDNAFGWRFFSAIFGTLCIYGVYRLTLALFQKKRVALLAAFLLSIEGLHLVQSRIGMNDIYMLTFVIWSLHQAFVGKWKHSAVLFGLALASKWSALYGLLPLALIYLHSHPFPLRPILHTIYYILHTLRLLAIVAIVYLLTFTPFFLSGHTWSQFFELHRQMWYYHTHLVATHAYQSTPWQWLFSLRPVWYWVEYSAKTANIYAQANPLILWLGLVALIVSLPRIRRFPYLLLVTCYAIFTLPWFFSPRIMFFYHYLPSATFLTIILASWLSSLPPRTRIFIIVLCSLFFVLLSPMYYGSPMPTQYWDTLFTLFPSWK